MELLIFASIGCLKTLILLKDLQSQNLNNYYVCLQRERETGKEKKISHFSMKTEKESKLSFLDVGIRREQGKFTLTIYRKPTFSGV